MVDPVSVARRRHTARTFIRLAALLLLGWSAVRLPSFLWTIFGGSGVFGSGWGGGSPAQIVVVLLAWLPVPGAAALLLIFERRLVAWLVPPPGTHRCPACDYDLRYITADRCPECGLDIRRGA